MTTSPEATAPGSTASDLAAPKTIGSLLVANRGEIAVRIFRTARALGLDTVAVYADPDADALHVREADAAVRLPGAAPAETYLRGELLVRAALAAGADAVHPGYGFLSENAEFAQACADAGIVFVGPPPSAILAMGLKDRAKALMEKAGVPVVPGYHGDMQEAKFLRQKAYEIGYPVLIKAVAGGGGKGMRRVDRHADFDASLAAAMREAKSAFGDERVLIEKYVTAPRHIEMQVFADGHGNAIHLNERDCSLQRRHQKVIEEAPAPGMSPGLRARMGAAAVAAVKAAGYEGAGTIEFIADSAGGLKQDGFWFMEMNTRLQVEHPVTEAVTGLDLVEWQF
ncbi:MAG: biotin carboxylase N-terminal domain-containing protein, partial [Actinomycetes bacterium]